MTNQARLEAIIKEVRGRVGTMYEGYEPRWDELLVAEIERLRGLVQTTADGVPYAEIPPHRLVFTFLGAGDVASAVVDSWDTVGVVVEVHGTKTGKSWFRHDHVFSSREAAEAAARASAKDADTERDAQWPTPTPRKNTRSENGS